MINKNFSLESLSENLKESLSLVYKLSNSLTNKSLKSEAKDNFFNIYEIYNLFLENFYSNPKKLADLQNNFVKQYVNIYVNILDKLYGKTSQSIYDSPSRDKRFLNSSWQNHPYFDLLKQVYFMSNQLTQQFLSSIQNLDKQSVKKFQFYIERFMEAISPSNFFFTNPDVLEKFLASNGSNLLNGLKRFAEDFEKNNFTLNIPTIEQNHFILGQDIAATRGKVIYQNDLMQLIHFEPLTEKNYSLPILIIPPWIKKYYVFDLSKDNSFVNWLLENNFSVFTISWVNPDEKLAHKNFEDYMLEGPIQALNIIENMTKIRSFSVMGYCIGGTLLAATLAYMAKKSDNRIKNATFLTTPINFEDMGDLSIFINKKQISYFESLAKKYGYLSGDKINHFFNIIKANEMIWSNFVNNYLLDNKSSIFDILYWNADDTRLTSSMFNFYLRNMYLNNSLIHSNKLMLDNVDIDLSLVKIPLYMLSTKSDHIVPWKNAYKATEIFKDNLEFVLATSGHVAGVINHPDKNKYSYHLNQNLSSNPEKWLQESQEIQGSWWNHWLGWNKKFSQLQDQSIFDLTKYFAIEDAPGSYVKTRYENNFR